MAKTILITGSTGGIGQAIAKTFAAKGYNIVCHGLEEQVAETLATLAAGYKVGFLFSPADLRDPAAIRSMVGQALREFGSLEVVIHNAGIQHVASLDTFPEEQWDAILAVNLTAAFHLIKAAWPGMKEKRFGRVINISSVHGLVASAYKSAYIAAKHGLVGLTRALALEGAPYGITVNAICPGYVETPLVERQIPDQMKVHGLSREAVIRDILLGDHAIKTFISKEAIAETAFFLADGGAAAGITGIALPVDAGWTAH